MYSDTDRDTDRAADRDTDRDTDTNMNTDTGHLGCYLYWNSPECFESREKIHLDKLSKIQ